MDLLEKGAMVKLVALWGYFDVYIRFLSVPPSPLLSVASAWSSLSEASSSGDGASRHRNV